MDERARAAFRAEIKGLALEPLQARAVAASIPAHRVDRAVAAARPEKALVELLCDTPTARAAGGGGPGSPPATLSSESADAHESAEAGMSLLRKKIRWLIFQESFEAAVLVAIIISSGCLALEHPLDDPDSTKAEVLRVLDIFFLVMFSIEMGLKLVALGVCKPKDAYFRSAWNWIDSICVVAVRHPELKLNIPAQVFWCELVC